MLTQKALRGTHDKLPGEAALFRWLEQTATETAANFGYNEIRTPLLEHTELFAPMGKEQQALCSFFDQEGQHVTLRPANNLGLVRACLEHGLLEGDMLPRKVCSLSVCCRGLPPQAGGARECTQFGAECFGSAHPAAEAELISLAVEFFSAVALTDYHVELSAAGCPICTQAEAKTKTLCGECSTHLAGVEALLAALEIPFVRNPGLEAAGCTRVAFAFVSDIAGMGTLGAGGRRDGVTEVLGGAAIPCAGFAIGLEPVLTQLQAAKSPLPILESCDLFIYSTGETLPLAAQLAAQVRAAGIRVQYDLLGRALPAQTEAAKRLKARYALTLNPKAAQAHLLHLFTGAEEHLPLEDFAEQLTETLLRQSQEELQIFFNT
ncbi:MAG: histidine--tRNA ligase [Oscillospiraceae bacterium]|nr:histidine--tRNA ligase [Oscillospiraceae bacterium]